ncbi:hypothetical protein HK096_008133 [Nowakowskiella sp. JEL0078]|nr:hypothetical protein HK096_008133 [Nowakowskiella sp. JEL0078]
MFGESDIDERLNSLLSLNYPTTSFSVNELSSIESSSSLYCRVLLKVFSKQKLVFEEKDIQCLEDCVDSPLKIQEKFKSSSIQLESCRGINALIFENGYLLQNIFDSLTDKLLVIALPTNSFLQTRHLAMSCLANLCSKTGSVKFVETQKKICHAALLALDIPHSSVNDGSLLEKIFFANNAIRSLQILLTENKSLSGEVGNALVSRLHPFVFDTALTGVIISFQIQKEF